MIKTVALEKIFRTEEVETLALNKVSIEEKEGEFVAIMGPSGCGKSTLLNILGLLDNPTSGEYYLNGIEVSRYTEAQRTADRRKRPDDVPHEPERSTWVCRLPSERKRYRKQWNGWRSCTAKSISRSSCPAASNSVSPLPAP